jgi:hypothetical protein
MALYMNRIHAHSLGLAFGLFLALWHALWAFLVWVGAAQWLLDFVFRLHMITPPYKVVAFSLGTAIALLLITASIGYVTGFVIGIIWNRCAVRTASN